MELLKEALVTNVILRYWGVAALNQGHIGALSPFNKLLIPQKTISSF